MKGAQAFTKKPMRAKMEKASSHPHLRLDRLVARRRRPVATMHSGTVIMEIMTIWAVEESARISLNVYPMNCYEFERTGAILLSRPISDNTNI
jgi:hypothetical protein